MQKTDIHEFKKGTIYQKKRFQMMESQKSFMFRDVSRSLLSEMVDNNDGKDSKDA